MLRRKCKTRLNYISVWMCKLEYVNVKQNAHEGRKIKLISLIISVGIWENNERNANN